MRLAKVLCLLAVFALVGPAYASDDERTYCDTITPKLFNDIWKRQLDVTFVINYDLADSEFRFYVKQPITVFGFSLDKAQANDLEALLTKYEEWRTKAVEKKVTLEKEIGTFDAKYAFWKMGSDWSMSGTMTISVYFFSQSTTHHQMIFMFPKQTSRSNKYDQHEGETLYFDPDQAAELKRVLGSAHYKGFLARMKKQDAIENEFQ